jgi:shikimate kinase
VERINVIGSSNAGKTTLARAIARRLQVPHVELDALYWGSSWTPVPEAAFRARVADALSGERWVADGGYQIARDITWSRADTIVWLDYPLHVVLRRWAGRTARRIRNREEFWPGTGNRETLWNAVRPSGLLWWILRHHRGKRRRTEARLAQRPDLNVVRLRSPRETDRWLASLPAGSGS